MREALLVVGHDWTNVGNLGFDCELKVGSLLQLEQFLIAEASIEDSLADLTSVPHQVSEEHDHIQERRLAASVRTDERSEGTYNAYLRDRFVPQHNATLSRAPRDPASAFVPLGAADIEQILCHEEERVVGRDNTVSFEGRAFQLDRQRGRRSCAGLRVTIRRHLSGDYSIWRGPRRLGRYAALERPADSRRATAPMEVVAPVDAKPASTAASKTRKPRFPQLPQPSI
jgi:hypothetical protein